MTTLGIEAQSPLANGERKAMAADVLKGLSSPKKSIPSRWLYDARGSELFEEITVLEEYYPTRTERSILEACAPEIAARTPSGSTLIEFGSGSSIKTEILLASLDKLAGYVPIDISEPALVDAVSRIQRRFPDLDVEPLVADFCDPVELPPHLADQPRIGFFPGSTIGNLQPDDAAILLERFAENLRSGGRLIIGVDLQKDVARLEAAYDDSEGVTAEFNLNLLRRLNRELDANFKLTGFKHRAVYNDREHRIEMHLVSRSAQSVSLLGKTFRFAAGETIHTENSYKYTVSGFKALAARAGWNHVQTWMDEKKLFSVHELVQD
ncbi:MAG: Histidine N-alpha-methyltransferase [Pseudomonadota bacterium]|jgi:dimethylhistidine N-methyltransferase